MGRRREVAPAEIVVPDWVLVCEVEDWVDVGAHRFRSGRCVAHGDLCTPTSVRAAAFLAFAAERRRWARDHDHTGPLPRVIPRWRDLAAVSVSRSDAGVRQDGRGSAPLVQEVRGVRI